MNVLIDTNAILDDILNRVPNADPAHRVNQLITDGLLHGYLTANCLTDIFYVVTKNKGETTARVVIKNLLLLFAVVSVDGDDCLRAIDLPMQDFEDALIVVCAEKANLDYIITNDQKFLSDSGFEVPTICPADFLLRFYKNI